MRVILVRLNTENKIRFAIELGTTFYTFYTKIKIFILTAMRRFKSVEAIKIK